MSDDGYLATTLGAFLEDVAAETPAPGGGSTAAIVTAMAAALAAMAARFSREMWEEAGAAAAQAEALRARVTPLAQEDAEAYEAVLTALRLHTDAEPGTRDTALGEAFLRAADVPLAIADAAVDVAALAADVAGKGNPNLRGDAAAAALLAEAAVRVCANLVEINLATGESDERLARARNLVEIARRISRRALETAP